jgi:hypothetical protein
MIFRPSSSVWRKLDQEWRDHFTQTNLPLRSREDDEERRQFMFDSLVADTSLQEVLLEQVRMSDLDEQDQKLAELIVGNIDDYGYLAVSLDELAATTGVPRTADRRPEPWSRLSTPRRGRPRPARVPDAAVGPRNARPSNTGWCAIAWTPWAAPDSGDQPQTERHLDDVQEAFRGWPTSIPGPDAPSCRIAINTWFRRCSCSRKARASVVSTSEDHIPRLRISNSTRI